MASDDLDPLFEFLCVDWGFCLSGDAVEAILLTQGLTPLRFADMVLAAEGAADPATNPWRDRIADQFRRFSEGLAPPPAA